MTVLASAIGPLLLAWCVEWTGSYAGMFNVLAAVIGLAAFSALLTPLPDAKPRPRDRHHLALTPAPLADHRLARHASGRRITSTVITSSRPIHIASVNTMRLIGCRSAKLRHRTDLVEARPDVAERRGGGRDPGDHIGAHQDDDRRTHRERQHVEEEEHDHALHDRRGHDAAAQLDRQDRARVQASAAVPAACKRASSTCRTTFGPPPPSPRSRR